VVKRKVFSWPENKWSFEQLYMVNILLRQFLSQKRSFYCFWDSGRKTLWRNLRNSRIELCMNVHPEFMDENTYPFPLSEIREYVDDILSGCE